MSDGAQERGRGTTKGEENPVYLITKDGERFGRKPSIDMEGSTLSYIDTVTEERETLVTEWIEHLEIGGHRILINGEWANEE